MDIKLREILAQKYTQELQNILAMEKGKIRDEMGIVVIDSLKKLG